MPIGHKNDLPYPAAAPVNAFLTLYHLGSHHPKAVLKKKNKETFWSIRENHGLLILFRNGDFK